MISRPTGQWFPFHSLTSPGVGKNRTGRHANQACTDALAVAHRSPDAVAVRSEHEMGVGLILPLLIATVVSAFV